MGALKIKKGDEVRVISGKDKGKSGRIKEVLLADSRVIVEGLNMVKKAVRPNQQNQKGAIEDREAAIHVSNVRLLSGGKPVKVARRKVDGKRVRVEAKSGKAIG